jgi:hypothetical protein
MYLMHSNHFTTRYLFSQRANQHLPGWTSENNAHFEVWGKPTRSIISLCNTPLCTLLVQMRNRLVFCFCVNRQKEETNRSKPCEVMTGPSHTDTVIPYTITMFTLTTCTLHTRFKKQWASDESFVLHALKFFSHVLLKRHLEVWEVHL